MQEQTNAQPHKTQMIPGNETKETEGLNTKRE